MIVDVNNGHFRQISPCWTSAQLLHGRSAADASPACAAALPRPAYESSFWAPEELHETSPNPLAAASCWRKQGEWVLEEMLADVQTDVPRAAVRRPLFVVIQPQISSLFRRPRRPNDDTIEKNCFSSRRRKFSSSAALICSALTIWAVYWICDRSL